MLGLDDVKLLHALSCVALCLIIATPTLTMVVSLPRGEQFSEIWLLGAGHMADEYPFNVEAHAVYPVYLGVGNHMGGLESYRVLVKFGNQTEPLSDMSGGMPSVLDPVFEYRVFLRDSEAWEAGVLFSFDDVLLEGSSCRVSNLVVDGQVFSVDTSTSWNDANRGFYFQLLFELWHYNVSREEFEFHNRFVKLWLNMTV